MDGVNQEHPDRAAEPPATVLCRQDWSRPSVVMVNVNQEPPDRFAESPVTVLSETIWFHRMPFVVTGSANAVYAMIIVVKTVTVLTDYNVRVLLIWQNVTATATAVVLKVRLLADLGDIDRDCCCLVGY